MRQLLNILYLENNPSDVALVLNLLKKDGIECNIVAVKNEDEFRNIIGQIKFDLILSDYLNPDFKGLKVLKYAGKKYPISPSSLSPIP